MGYLVQNGHQHLIKIQLCSCHDIAEKSVFGFRQQSITLAYPLLPVTNILPADFHCLNKVHQDMTLVQTCV
jgi:hypothetical protein